MIELKELPLKEKLYITERPNYVVKILCQSLIGECTEKIISDSDNIKDNIIHRKAVVISNLSKSNCSSIYKFYLRNSFYLGQLDYLDFDEKEFDQDTILMLTFYNLELFYNKSLRSKAKFIIQNPLKQFKKENYIKLFDDNSIDIPPISCLFLYRIIAFNSIDSVHNLCLILKEINRHDIPQSLEIIFNFCKHYDSTIIFCNALVEFYLRIRSTDDENKKLVFEILKHFYRNIKINSLKKIKFGLTPIMCYCLQNDMKGEYLHEIEKFIHQGFPQTSNHYILKILMYSYIYNNEIYKDTFIKAYLKPKTKIESVFNNVFILLKNLLSKDDHNELSGLQKVIGVDEYLLQILHNKVPVNPSKFFNILKSN